MLRILLAILLVLHGAAHLMGFVKAFGLARIPALTTWIGKPMGAAWGIAAVLFFAACLVLLVGSDRWWMPAALAVVLSQALIALNWHDARFGTVVNMLLLMAVIAGAGVWDFRARYTSAVVRIEESTRDRPRHRITEEDLAPLPQPVQRYLRATGVLGSVRPRNMRITFEGDIRAFDGPWMPFTSVQTNGFGAPARFFWIDATMKALPTKGLHAYENGQATMLIKLLGLMPVMEARGPEMDKAETVTWFNDLCIYAPAALVDPRITWAEVDDRSANAIFTDATRSISATLVFNAEDRLIDFFSDDRSAIEGGRSKPMRFSTPLRDHRMINGLVLPGYGETVWHRPEGPFTYGRFTLLSIAYDVQPSERTPYQEGRTVSALGRVADSHVARQAEGAQLPFPRSEDRPGTEDLVGSKVRPGLSSGGPWPMERSMRPAPPEQQRAMEFKRWFFQDDTARWLSQANRFLLLATFVLLMLLAFVWLRW